MKKVDRLMSQIESFLQEKKKSVGGYAPVSEKEIDQLEKIFSTIIALKYDCDPDRDFPVEYVLIDRTRFHRLHYLPIPYTFDAKTDKEYFDALVLEKINARIASEALDCDLQLYMNFKRRTQEK